MFAQVEAIAPAQFVMPCAEENQYPAMEWFVEFDKAYLPVRVGDTVYIIHDFATTMSEDECTDVGGRYGVQQGPKDTLVGSTPITLRAATLQGIVEAIAADAGV
jgi:hypothetical protein